MRFIKLFTLCDYRNPVQFCFHIFHNIFALNIHNLFIFNIFLVIRNRYFSFPNIFFFYFLSILLLFPFLSLNSMCFFLISISILCGQQLFQWLCTCSNVLNDISRCRYCIQPTNLFFFFHFKIQIIRKAAAPINSFNQKKFMNKLNTIQLNILFFISFYQMLRCKMF